MVIKTIKEPASEPFSYLMFNLNSSTKAFASVVNNCHMYNLSEIRVPYFWHFVNGNRMRGEEGDTPCYVLKLSSPEVSLDTEVGDLPIFINSNIPKSRRCQRYLQHFWLGA